MEKSDSSIESRWTESLNTSAVLWHTLGESVASNSFTTSDLHKDDDNNAVAWMYIKLTRKLSLTSLIMPLY